MPKMSSEPTSRVGETGVSESRVDWRSAASYEAAEANAWADLYAAAPAAWAADAGIGARNVGGALALRWAASGRRYFSRVIGLGVLEPASRAAIEEILEGYERAGITMFLLQSLPACRPLEYESWLRGVGLEPFDAQQRVVRNGSPLAVSSTPAGDRDLKVERVTAGDATEWVEFIERVYRLDTGPWLSNLIGRPGWQQYVVRDAGEIIAARGMHVGVDGVAWLGMDGPVPGITTDDYEPDAALCAFIVADGLARGARSFIADIEAPSPERDTPAYETFARLGFTRPYLRTHWTRWS
jgi:hypothetical protein